MIRRRAIGNSDEIIITRDAANAFTKKIMTYYYEQGYIKNPDVITRKEALSRKGCGYYEASWGSKAGDNSYTQYFENATSFAYASSTPESNVFVIVPKNVTSCGDYAFYRYHEGCIIVFLGSPPTFSIFSFEQCTSVKVYVKDDNISAYQNNTNFAYALNKGRVILYPISELDDVYKSRIKVKY